MHSFEFINKFLHRHHVEPTTEEDIIKRNKKNNKKVNSWKQMFLFDDDDDTTQDTHMQKYLNDPMRNTNRPDKLGEFYDPMAVYHQGQLITMPYDITNTGA